MAFTKTFTYKIADDYLAQTASKNRTAEWTYEGPRYLFVFVNKETGLFQPSQHCSSSNIAPTAVDIESINIRAGRDQIAVFIDMGSETLTEEEAVIASMIFGKDTSAKSGYPQKTYKLKGDPQVYYSRPEPPAPDHTYASNGIEYDIEAGAWITPLPWFQPWVTMEQHTAARDGILENCKLTLEAEATENGGQGNLTDEMRKKLQDYVTELEGVYTKFAGWEAHTIPFPDDPRTDWIDGYDYRVNDYDSLVAAESGLSKLPETKEPATT